MRMLAPTGITRIDGRGFSATCDKFGAADVPSQLVNDALEAGWRYDPFTRDSKGVPTGLTDGQSSVSLASARSPRTLLLAGDSISAISEVILGATSVVDNGDGTGTATKGSSWGASVGEPVRISAATTQSLNVMDSTITAITNGGNSIVFSLGGRTHSVTAPSGPNVIFPNRRGCRGWLNQMESILGISFKTTWCAVGGATASQINDLVNATPMPEGGTFDEGVVEIGMNNIYSAGEDTATAWPKIQALIDNVRARCGLLKVLLIPCRNSADANWTAQRQIYHTQLNRLIYDYTLLVGGFVIDTWRATQNGLTYVNPAATNPDPTSVMMFDNTHQALPGALAIGRAAAVPTQARMGAPGWKPSHSEMLLADAGNLLTDAAFLTETSGVATGWSVISDSNVQVSSTSRVARTVASDGDGAGFNQQMLFRYIGGGSGNTGRMRKTAMQALVAPYVGKKVQFKMQFSLSGAVGLIGLELAMFGTLPGGQSWQVYGNGIDSSAKAVVGALSGTLMTPEVIVPAGLTNLDIWVRPYFDATQTTDMTLLVWHPDLRVVV